MRALAVGVACVLVAGCGPTREEDGVGLVREAIVGGVTDSADPQLFELTIVGNNMMASTCSATLIASRTLLTAAHCVDPRIMNATSITIYAMNKTDDSTAYQSDYIQVSEMQYHPQWNPNDLSNDIGLAYLSRAPTGITPKPWNTNSVAGLSGQPLRAAGYGTTGAAGNGAGIKRQVDLTFRQVTSNLIMIGNQTSKGICHGDSGGPSFHTFSDGVERVVGVHSFTIDQTCFDGADTRVDQQLPFINAWLAQKEVPTCAEDGRCKTGCTPIDIDCACAADGMCTAACPDLLKDPDCSPDCVANGICAQANCPVPDPDCSAFGATCASPLNCVGRKCVTDPEHGNPYCSKTCAASTECPPDMECGATGVCNYKQLPVVNKGAPCTVGQQACALGTVCSGDLAGATVCVQGCAVATDCSEAGSSCTAGFDGQLYCHPKVVPAIYLPLATTEGPPADGCSAAPAGLGGVLALLGLLGRRRRR